MSGDVIEEIVVKEEPAFELVGVFTISHRDDDKTRVYWSDLKECGVGDTWEAIGNSSVQIATVLYKDDGGVFIRFVEEDHNELTDYDDVVWCNYYDFGRYQD